MSPTTHIRTGDQPRTALLPDAAHLGPVHITVTNLVRSLDFYERALGLKVHELGDGSAALGAGADDVLVLAEDATASQPGRHAGLFHFALLYPTRIELARAAQRLAATDTSIQGMSDHHTHEALYLSDPDGNGIELAADRPRESWPKDWGYSGRPDPLDIESLLALVEGVDPTDRVELGLTVGHLHLHVSDIAQAIDFYRDVIGFDVIMTMETAAFVSAGGYHHHLGLNVWKGEGIAPQPEGIVGLRHWTLVLDDQHAVDQLVARAREAQAPVETFADGAVVVRDPWNMALLVSAS